MVLKPHQSAAPRAGRLSSHPHRCALELRADAVGALQPGRVRECGLAEVDSGAASGAVAPVAGIRADEIGAGRGGVGVAPILRRVFADWREVA